MANWFIGINRGKTESPANILTGTSTQSTDVEIRIDTGKSSTKEDVIKAMRAMEIHILSNGVPTGSGTGTNLPPN